MAPDEHQPTNTPDAPPRQPPQWEQRLEKAWRWCFYILLVTFSLDIGKPFNIHLTGMLQRLASIVFVAAFVPYALIGMTLIFRTRQRNPPPNRLYAWGAYLLVAGLLVALPFGFWLYLADSVGHLSEWHFSRMDQLVFVAILMLIVISMFMGLVLLVAAFIRDLGRLARSLWLGPPSGSRD